MFPGIHTIFRHLGGDIFRHVGGEHLARLIRALYLRTKLVCGRFGYNVYTELFSAMRPRPWLLLCVSLHGVGAWPPAFMASHPGSTASTTASPRPTPTIDMTASTAMAPPTTCGMPTLLCSKLLLCHNWQELRPARRPLNRPLRARSSRPVASTIRFWNTSAARYRCTHGPIAHSAQWLYPSWGTGYLRQPSPIVGLRRAFRRQLCWVTDMTASTAMAPPPTCALHSQP